MLFGSNFIPVKKYDTGDGEYWVHFHQTTSVNDLHVSHYGTSPWLTPAAQTAQIKRVSSFQKWFCTFHNIIAQSTGKLSSKGVQLSLIREAPPVLHCVAVWRSSSSLLATLLPVYLCVENLYVWK